MNRGIRRNPESRVMKIKVAATLLGLLVVVLSACGGNETDSAPSSPSSSTATSTTEATAATTTATVEPEPATIVGCQQGYDPVQTTWSDGTVTGYSDYCQSVRDEFVRNEETSESGQTQYVCESGLPCGIDESDGVVCDESGCRDTRAG